MNDPFSEQAEALLAWTKDHALPLWQTAAADPAGGYFESLDHQGQPIKGAPKRLRVQARQAFSFARAEHLGLLPSGRQASDRAWRFMLDHGRRATPHGLAGFIHVFGPDGSVTDDTIDLYDHAFVLLASSERELRYGDDEARTVSAEVIALIESLRLPNGGFAEGIPAMLPRRTNAHMHLLEACLVRRQLGCAFAESTIDEIQQLWRQHFWDDEREVLREFFDEDWSRNGDAGDVIEPGHMAEWLYLLDAEGGLEPGLARTIFDRARATGLHVDAPVLADTFALDTGLRSDGCRLWCQTEHIRAAVVMARRTGEERYRALAADLIAAFRRLYLDPVVAGGWIDRIDGTGNVLSDKMPTSLLYHTLTAAEEVAHLHQPQGSAR